MITFPGYYGDVFACPRGLGCLYSIHQSKRLILLINGNVEQQIDIPDDLLYLKAWCNPAGIIGWIAQPQSIKNQTMYGYIYPNSNPTTDFLNILCYSRPAIWFNGTTFVYYIQNSPSTYLANGLQVMFLFGENGLQYNIPIWPGGNGTTSQGIWQILNDGTIIWTDPNRSIKYGNTTVLFGCQSNGLVIGQGQESGMVGVGLDGSNPFLAMNFNPMEPRAIYSPVVNKWGCYSWGQGAIGAYNECPPFNPIPGPNPIPVPPNPTPIPPVPPQGVKMKSDYTVTELLNLKDLTEVPHPDGKGLVALKTPDGKYKSLTPTGQWNPDASSPGAWERFFPFGGGWYAYREDTKRTFIVTSRVPVLPYQS